MAVTKYFQKTFCKLDLPKKNATGLFSINFPIFDTSVYRLWKQNDKSKNDHIFWSKLFCVPKDPVFYCLMKIIKSLNFYQNSILGLVKISQKCFGKNLVI